MGWWTNFGHENSLALFAVTNWLHIVSLASSVQTSQMIVHYSLHLHLRQQVDLDNYQGLSLTFFDPEMPLYCCMVNLDLCFETILDFVWSCSFTAMAFTDCSENHSVLIFCLLWVLTNFYCFRLNLHRSFAQQVQALELIGQAQNWSALYYH